MSSIMLTAVGSVNCMVSVKSKIDLIDGMMHVAVLGWTLSHKLQILGLSCCVQWEWELF